MVRVIRQSGPYSYLYSRYNAPIASVKPGETIAIYTTDAFGDRISAETDVPTKILDQYSNPQTGPIHIEGAEPGDTLAVHIINIEFTRDWAVSMLKPFFGGLTSTSSTRLLNEPLPEMVWIYQIEDGMAIHKDFKFEINPFLGTVGTAPEMEALSTLTPFNHGGNMDVPDVRPGNTVYLPVRVPGAYFYTGDCHALQGDGELCGVALEISAKVTLKFDLIKHMTIEWPRIESPTELMAVGSARPMEDAARIAYAELIVWLQELGWDKWKAYQALTQIGKLHVGNMVDTYYSLVAKVDKKYAFMHKA